MRLTLTDLKDFKVTYPAGNVAKNIRISDSLQGLKVIGDSKDNGMKEQLIEFNSGQYMSEIEDSCFEGCNTLSKVILQSSINNIGNNAFKDCINLSSINLDNSPYEQIGNNAFENIKVEKLVFEYYISKNGKIGSGIFKNCKKLNLAELTTNYIPSDIFYNCQNLKTVQLTLSGIDNENTIYIDENAFNNIDNVELIGINGNIDIFPLFSNLSNLQQLHLSSNSQFSLILDYSFANTPKLTSFTIGDFITSIRQLQSNALSGSSILLLTLNGITYLQLLDDVNVDVKSKLDSNFVVARSAGNNDSVDKTRRTTSQYRIRNSATPSPLQQRAIENSNKPFYYGKIYNNINDALSFSLTNKVPLFVFGGLGIEYDSRYIFSSALFYEWIELQNCIVCFIGENNMFKNNKACTENKAIITDVGSYTTLYHYYDSRFKLYIGKSVIEYGGLVENRPEIKQRGKVWSCGYVGDPEIEMDWDGSLTILAFNAKNNIETVYKFLNTNTGLYLQLMSYDLSTDTFGTYTPTNANEKARLCTFSDFPGDRYFLYDGWNWPTRSLGMIIAPTSTTTQETTSYASHKYMPNKNMLSGTRYVNGIPIDKNALSFNEIYKNTTIVDIIGCDVRGINLSENADGHLQLMTNRPYKLMVGDKTYEQYFANIPQKIEAGMIDNGAGYLYMSYKSNPEYEKNKWLVDKATNFKSGKYGGYSCEFDHGVKNAMLILDYEVGNFLKNYPRNPAYNAPDYIKKDINIQHINDEKVPFNCWGIGHDCTIITSDGIRCKWNEKTKKLTK